MLIDSIRSKVTEFIERVSLVSFEDERIYPHSNLFELGVLDSYGLIEVILFIEQEFSVKLSDEDMLSPDLSNLDGISRIVASRAAATES
jgi:acyl carrier protein